MRLATSLDNLKRAFDAAIQLGMELAYWAILAIRESAGRLLGSIDAAEGFLTECY